MRVFDFSREHAEAVELFDSRRAASVHLGDGGGESHVYCIFFDRGAEIGAHRAGFDQLFLVVEGEAWAAGEDGRHVRLRAGQGAQFARGETHSKGSDEGAVVIMIQTGELALKAPSSEEPGYAPEN
jgi:quercetin dioxygenase-like cupin family protein